MSRYTSISSFFRTVKFFFLPWSNTPCFSPCLDWVISLVLTLCLDISVIKGALILYRSIFSPFPSTAVSTILDLAFAFAISYLPFNFLASFSAICCLIKSDCSASSSASFVFSSIDFVLEFSDLLLQLNLFEAGVKIAVGCKQKLDKNLF